MSGLQVADVAGAAFSTSSAADASGITVRMAGNADMAAIRSLESFTKALHDEAARVRAPRVSVDLRELYFMNSSCLKVLVVWITNVQKLPEGERYPIRFVANANLPWQQRSIVALKRLAEDLVDYEMKG